MAMGRALITTDSVGCKETISPNKDSLNGFLVPIKNPFILAEKMLHFVSNPSDKATFGKNSWLFAKEKFDVNIINKQMLQVLEQNPS
jgi:glycosyltransferase involved in cell wall biosynthesis